MHQLHHSTMRHRKIGCLAVAGLAVMAPGPLRAQSSCEPNCIGSSHSNSPNIPQSDGSSNSDVPNIPNNRPAGNWQLTKDCLPEFNEWQGLNGRGAFALSQDGSSCGYSFDYRSRSEARNRAMSECSARGSNCKIVSEK